MRGTNKGIFIAFEGLDGSGKTTQAELLARRLKTVGVDSWITGEPTDSRIGQLIHDHMKKILHLNEETVAALFVADRLNHLLDRDNGICKRLADNISVITDRYYFSSYAYHSVHVPMAWVIGANSINANILRPDMNIFVNVPPKVCFERIYARGKHCQRYESIEHLEKVQKNYFDAFDKLKSEEKIVVVDGTKDINHVADDIWENVITLTERKQFSGNACSSH